MLLATSALAGCGGSDDDGDDPVVPPTQPPVTEPGQASVDKVLFIGVDGLTYDALRRGLADKSLANIGQLTATRAWTGGVTGTATQQPTLIVPGWATLLTGQWADVHGVRSNAQGQALKAPSLFQRVKTAQPEARIAGAFNSPLVAGLLGTDRDAGYVQSLTDCAGVDDCVASQARDRIAEGYDMVVAQFGAPERAAAESGFGTTYEAVIRQTDAAIGVLAKQLADRRADHPNENWLMVVASSHGLDKTGGSDGLPFSSSKTILLAANQPVLLGGSADDAAFDGLWDANWYALPSAADLAPTVLAHLDALPSGAAYDMAGTSLTEPLALRRVATRTSMDNKSVTVTWVRVGEPDGDIVVSRDGTEVARLPGTATEYVDTGFTFDTEGVHELAYSVSAGHAVSAARATVVYAKPVPLLASLRTGLTMFFPFEGDVADVAAGGGAITPYDGAQAPAYAEPGVFGKSFRNERGSAALGAFKLDYPAGLMDSVQAFTIGFWFQSDGTANDRSIVGNKDYNSGGNPGITIAQWAGPELRFNIAGGGKRADINGVKFTANKPVYIAMTIDKTARTMTAYRYDSELGFVRTVTSTATAGVDLGAVAGVFGPHIGLNEDGKGTYGICCAGTKGPYTMIFDDLAFWSRALTEDEVKSLALSGKSVSELFP
ncbi:type I phosphodiesterase/nucleotide pyrophosphatase family protein 1 [Achromobacter arsenitoxydans SY8]|uniref:Type I phosphodiesterase/nucleotide pyrophosphatase family protein 1 n=2 Tax=Achromobacter TaxID=222 RepID=H0F1V6_9BURK|nr:type I phosphodiesterase/nucleotide pyrophosphatase family protein 1 [Achromobacter arsenitoxydans SY8]